jgi:para-aminobenzoate synthetase component I
MAALEIAAENWLKMQPFIQSTATRHTPDSLAAQLLGEPGLILLRSGLFDPMHARYSLLTARPFLQLRSFGSKCELCAAGVTSVQFGDPWRILESLVQRYELLEQLDLPFPLGGCFGFWGYDLKNFVEPRLPRRAINDLELPDCSLGFYDSLVVFDHQLGKVWIVSTGLQTDGSRTEEIARARLEWWQEQLATAPAGQEVSGLFAREQRPDSPPLISSFSKARFVEAVERARRYIFAGDIYQVNLSHRISAPAPSSAWQFFQALASVSPSPFAAYYDAGCFQLCSSSPELFLRLSGAHVQTRPIKGTRPRSADPTRDAQLTYELQTSAKEAAELVMITDLLRNDLGRVCEYGSVQVPELMRLERYAHVQHLVSTVEGRLRADVTHSSALASCFPGGSITGAPKIRAMEIIDEIEPVTRGPYTGTLGYLGFNRESQFSILIRTAMFREGCVHFYTGAGIVADSNPEAEYDETLAKARGFLEVVGGRAFVGDQINPSHQTLTYPQP